MQIRLPIIEMFNEKYDFVHYRNEPVERAEVLF